MTVSVDGPVAASVVGPNAGSLPFDVLRRPGLVSGEVDLLAVRSAFADLGRVDGAGPRLLVGRCEPTAAFTGRDALLSGYAAAREAAAAHGFAPSLRHVGGHLAAYDAESLVVHLWAPGPHAASGIQRRFSLLGAAIADALASLGVPDVAVGAVPGEYCDGRWSVNSGGRHKLVGTGQRVGKRGWVYSAVVTVGPAGPLRGVLTDCYDALGLGLDPETVGSVADLAPGTTWHETCEAVVGAVAGCVRTHDLTASAEPHPSGPPVAGSIAG